MIAGVDWAVLADQHHSNDSGGCSCSVADCRMLAQVERWRREAEQALLPGPPPRVQAFRSVFAPGEVEQ